MMIIQKRLYVLNQTLSSGILQWPIDKLATLCVHVLCVCVYLCVKITIHKQLGISKFCSCLMTISTAPIHQHLASIYCSSNNRYIILWFPPFHQINICKETWFPMIKVMKEVHQPQNWLSNIISSFPYA